jgi:hypothetical protein
MYNNTSFSVGVVVTMVIVVGLSIFALSWMPKGSGLKG